MAARSSAAVRLTVGSLRRERLAGGGFASSTESDSGPLLRTLVIWWLLFKADMTCRELWLSRASVKVLMNAHTRGQATGPRN